MTVSFSTRAPNSDYLGFEASPEAIVAAAKKAEEVGFDAIFVNDHIVVGDDARSAPWTNVYDPFVAMSFIAAHTTRIGVGVSVLIMPYRNPVASAKALATLDRMSGGRLLAGVGVGWNETEFATLGVPFHERSRAPHISAMHSGSPRKPTGSGCRGQRHSSSFPRANRRLDPVA